MSNGKYHQRTDVAVHAVLRWLVKASIGGERRKDGVALLLLDKTVIVKQWFIK